MRNIYHVYILTNKHHTVLYTGVAGDIIKRIWQHKQQLTEGFTKRYNVTKLVYVESFGQIDEAISREKQIKASSRQKKLDSIKKGSLQNLIVIANGVRRSPFRGFGRESFPIPSWPPPFQGKH